MRSSSKTPPPPSKLQHEMNADDDSDETGPADDLCEEPILKYQRMQADVGAIIASGERITRVTLNDNFLAIGTEKGKVFLTDSHGNLGRTLQSHKGAINDLSSDASGDFLASCSQDGTVVVTNLQLTQNKESKDSGADSDIAVESSEDIYSYGSPMMTVHLDPLFKSRRDKAFIAGGSSGKLILNKKGWFTQKESILHEGEGCITAIAWRESLVAWANVRGMKIMDVEKEEPISGLVKPRGVADYKGHKPRCQLHWESDSCLLMAWGDTFLMLQIGTREVSGVNTLTGRARGASEGQGMLESVVKGTTSRIERVAEITVIWQSDCVICGISPFDSELLVLFGYPVPFISDSVNDSSSSRDGSKASHIQQPSYVQPEIQLVNRTTGKVVSADALPINNWEQNLASHYCFDSTSWNPGYIRWLKLNPVLEDATNGIMPNLSFKREKTTTKPPVLFISAPKDLVVAKVRNTDDRISWALSKGDVKKAIKIALNNKHALKLHSYNDLVSRRMEELIKHNKYDEAAKECPYMLGTDTSLWEKYIFGFAKKGKLVEMAPYVPPYPVSDGNSSAQHAASFCLPSSIYMTILEHIMVAKPSLFLATIRRWGNPLEQKSDEKEEQENNSLKAQEPSTANKSLYAISSLLSSIDSSIKTRPDPYVLEAKAVLLLYNRQYGQAISTYLTMARIKDSAATEKEKGEGKNSAKHKMQEKVDISRKNQNEDAADKQNEKYARIFRLIEQHDLFELVQNRVLELVLLSQADSEEFLIRHIDKLPASKVVPQLRHRRDLQHWYLHLLFTQIPEVYNTVDYAQFHTLQVSLYAEFSPPFEPRRPPPYDSDFLRFLAGSAFAPLETALAECERRRPPLWDEVVYILGRLGKTQRALSVLLEEVDCAKRAIEFVGIHDSELWYRLIEYSRKNERFLGGLLDHAGVYDVDIPGLIRGIPDGMKIRGLRAKLGKITSDYRFQVTVHEACLSSLRFDHLDEIRRLNQLRRRALRVNKPDFPLAKNNRKSDIGYYIFACGHTFQSDSGLLQSSSGHSFKAVLNCPTCKSRK